MPSEPGDGAAPTPNVSAQAQALAAALADSFRDQVQRALGVELTLEVVALAFADHQLQALRDEDREPIVSLVAAAAGAWFGELVCEHVGATWLGDGKDPRKLRLLLEPAFCHFSPVDLAYEAIFSGDVSPDDPRAPAGALVDGAFNLDPRPNPVGDPEPSPPPLEADQDEGEDQDAEGDRSDDDGAVQSKYTHDVTSDSEWIQARLAELAPVDPDTYYSLTGRFEALILVLEMLAHRRVAERKSPVSFGVPEYLAALAGAGTPKGPPN